MLCLSVLTFLIFHKILFQQVDAESKNSHVINLTEAEYPIGYQIDGTDNAHQSEKEYDNGFNRYIPVNAVQVISDQG